MEESKVNLSNLFSDLKRFDQNEEYDKALKTANKILNVNQSNKKAIHCKLVCQIQLNKFNEALIFLNTLNNDLKSDFNFGKAYCEYRLNKIDEAFESLKLADSDDFGVKELETQTLYRIEDFDNCYAKYVELIKNSGDDYESERYVNLSAAIVGLATENENFLQKDLLQEEVTYEIIYNKACVLIAKGSYDLAIKKLNEAEALCRKTLEEDGLNEEEIETELAIIRAQIAFCYQKNNKEDIALKMYNQIHRQKLSDVALISVASNNIVAIHKDQNLFDSKKKIKLALNENAEFKLSSNQKSNILYNYCLFLININQLDTCKKQLEIFKDKFPNNKADVSIIESFLLIKEKNTDQGIKVLSDFCSNQKTFSRNDLELVLLLVLLLMKAEKFADAAKILEKLGKLKYLPAIVSTLYLLYEKTGQHKSIETLFTDTIKWYQNKKNSTQTLTILYREAAKFYLNQNKPQFAVEFLEKIIDLKGKNPKITSMLINAYSQFDLSKAQSLQKELPSIGEILSSVDIEHLENKNWSLGVKYVKKSKDTPKTLEKTKNKKKRKTILPKNFNPNEAPDPERWLPKYERSTYRKKKEKKGVGKGTQGAIGDVPEVKPSTKQVASPQGPRQQRPTQKKKKKGGRK